MIKTNWYTTSCKYYKCSGLITIYCFAKTAPSIFYDTFEGVDKTWLNLYVPQGCKEKYQNANYWKDFKYIYEFDVTPITQINKDNVTGEAIYDLSGRQQSKTDKGINIIRFSDGTTKKVLVK